MLSPNYSADDIDPSSEVRRRRAFTGRLTLRLEAEWVDRIVERFPEELELDLRAAMEVSDDAGNSFHGPHVHDLIDGLPTARLVHRWTLAETRDKERTRGAAALRSYHSLNSYFSVDGQGMTLPELKRLATRLRNQPGVAAAFVEPSVGLPGSVSADEWTYEAGLFRGQGYVYGDHDYGSDWSGIHADAVWDEYDGTGVKLVDLELGWRLEHPDLPKPDGAPIPLLDPATMRNVNARPERRHGTQALGVVIAVDHDDEGLGVVGIAPGVDVPGLASISYPGKSDWEIVDAIGAAIDALGHGDVLLLEVQAEADAEAGGTKIGLPDGYPIEIHEPWLNAIRLAVLHGITVIEPAGNPTNKVPSLNMDTVKWPPADPNARSLDPDDPSHVDSGAIMVGACGDRPVANNLHNRAAGHWYGKRINCYAWADKVLTTSCSGLSLPDGTYNSVSECLDGDPGAKTYNYFTGTSAASAVIAGAAVLTHEMYRETLAVPALPETVRAILGDANLGTPVGDIGGTIRSMPDLGLIAASLTAMPNVYVRDSLADVGEEPSEVVSMSPDVFVLSTQLNVANPGPPYDDPASFVPNDLVAADSDNYVYVRISNLSTAADAVGCDALVYWAPTSSLLLPSDWREIDWLPAPVDVPVGGQALGGPVVWHPTAAELPTGGHGCFIAQLDHPHDPRPIPAPDLVTWTEFLNYIGRSNNVAWRNFNVAQPMAAAPSASAVFGGEWEHADFFMRGAPDRPVHFEFAIVPEEVPEDACLLWKIPRRAFRRGATQDAFGGAARVWNEDGRSTVLELPASRTTLLRRVWLPADAAIPTSMGMVLPTAATRSKPARISLRQYFRGLEVGRITWEFGLRG